MVHVSKPVYEPLYTCLREQHDKSHLNTPSFFLKYTLLTNTLSDGYIYSYCLNKKQESIMRLNYSSQVTCLKTILPINEPVS